MGTPQCATPYCLPPLLVLVVVACLLHHRVAAESLPDEAELLLQIKRAWGDPPMLAAWNTAASTAGAHCCWPHVGCNLAGRVTKIAIVITNINGTIPDAIGGLSSLTHLDVSFNNITGMFLTMLYRCSSLRYLDLSHNYIGGELPVDIGHGLGVNLSTLDLSFNEFNGTIPPTLSRLQKLRYLRLDNNRFTGTMPVELGELTSLEVLSLGNSSFDARELPAWFENLTNLVILYLENCSLTGDFPSYLVKMSELEVLFVAGNSLTGNIPQGFGASRSWECSFYMIICSLVVWLLMAFLR